MEEGSSFFQKPKDPIGFNHVRISLASPEKIRAWSHGEVKKPETINYRTFKPEKDGLFCAKIFGPTRDYECNCGKYKRMKHRGVVCEKCGVEVILAKVRRERMGHIELASPVAHIWFLKSLPSKIGNLLDISLKDMEKILYFDSYIVISSSTPDIKKGELLTDEKYRELSISHIGEFEAGIGAEAVQKLIKEINLDELSATLRKEMETSTSEAKRKKLVKRLRIVEAFRDSGNDPAWMILDVIPVLPPDLRPLVPLEGGRFATSDLNDLYRRVINRNNRLKKLIELGAPEIIVKNEKRMLQEAVDVLFDNGRRGKTITGANKRALKSLSDMLKGKGGRFRQNLLGKRVDYSGRSVIVVGPDLRLHQCGLPKKMALELFKPFIYHRLEEKGVTSTLKASKKLVERETDEVWDTLSEVVREYPILLNRAPTLHRLGIQAFEPVLIEGKAIQLHPLVCTAFNADFDGDQMAVHVPLSNESQTEARCLMMSTNNILSPANGEPVIVPTQDIVLGLYYLTMEKPGAKGEGRLFSGMTEVRMAFDFGALDLQAKIKVRLDGVLHDTTCGRVLLYEIMPAAIQFSEVNKLMKKSALKEIVAFAFRRCGTKETVLLADKIKDLGYRYATRAGISICIANMIIPDSKPSILAAAEKSVREAEQEFKSGSLTVSERNNKIIDIWERAKDNLASAMMEQMRTKKLDAQVVGPGGDTGAEGFNPIYMMSDSGSRGNRDQMRQLSGMRGLMSKPTGEIIDQPITANFREGLSVLQYFVSTHGARKGLIDTALKTSNSGYLTRRLVDVAQDSIILEADCKPVNGFIEVEPLRDGPLTLQTLGERILGRVAFEDIVDSGTKEVLVKAGEEIDEEAVLAIKKSGLTRVKIRSVLTCESKKGICAKCYGRDLAHGKLIEIGESVGIIAAQSIGEPGTQLTMRTFHIGGTASQKQTTSSISVGIHGEVDFSRDVRLIRSVNNELVVMSRKGELYVKDDDGIPRETHILGHAARLKFRYKRGLLGNTIPEGSEALKLLSGYPDKILHAVTGMKGHGAEAKKNQEMVNQLFMEVAQILGAADAMDSNGQLSPLHLDNPYVSEIASMWSDLLDSVNRSAIHLDEYNLQFDEDKKRLEEDYDLKVKAGMVCVVWDQFARHILTDFTGVVKYRDLIDGQTVITKEDDQTSKSERVVIEYKGTQDVRPRIAILDTRGSPIKTSKDVEISYPLPLNANLLVDDGVKVFAGQSLAKITNETSKTKDITGGLPRVSELFEVRKPKEVAIISEIDGTVSFSPLTSKGKRRIVVTPDNGEPKSYEIPKSKHVIVSENDYVHSGEKLIDGAANPQDILTIRGANELAKYIVDEVQKIYRGEGVHINDKHIEVIVRQMLRKVRVTHSGDTGLLEGESVERQRFNLINEEAIKEGKTPATGAPVLQGITKASLSTESFISAASFQETTKVLTEASVAGKVDTLTDLKANVIMGRLIPAGTGLHKYLMRIPKTQRETEEAVNQ
ncbi:MAG: DNA-directed RNA polymerase subunit beta' [Deltaproteobacteria bacterium]|jgi:DNA-directed RNA polymerase subunit beta'|nr:DNA-directed RNA polymerase subunit beta' [Deltaproteobacteria bacterium]